jgi:hypothetical protein
MGVGSWEEPVQCFTQQDALYVANLIHRDSRAVIKVVRYGLNIQCFPDEHAVALVERQIAQQSIGSNIAPAGANDSSFVRVNMEELSAFFSSGAPDATQF